MSKLYRIKVTSTIGEVLDYLNAAGRINPLEDSYHYGKLPIAQIMVRLQTGRYEDTTLSK